MKSATPNAPHRATPEPKRKICANCGKEFDNHRIKFCSDACLNEAYKKTNSIREYRCEPYVYPCARCGAKEVRTVGCVCHKCGRLREILRSKTTWIWFSKGSKLVCFSESGEWVAQPKALADHNKALGKDVFTPDQINEKWCSKNLILEIESIKAELEGDKEQ